MSTKTKDIITSIAALLLTIIGIVFVIFYKKDSPQIIITNIPKTQDATATLPIIDSPVASSTSSGLEQSTGNLVSAPYFSSEETYKSNYNNELYRIALNGKFSSMKIVLRGKVVDPGEHFVSFNLDHLSGVLNSSRSSIQNLDIEASRKLSGIYSQGDIEIVVDFFGDTIMSTSKEEFVLNQQGSKIVKLWDYIKPTPSVANFLFASFNKNGKYGGVEINSVEVKYTCETQDGCGISRCDKNILYTECLANNFGLDSAKKWCDKTQAAGCNNIR